MEAASPAMRRLLGLEQKPASPARGLPTGGSVTIRADVRSPDSSRYIREALISFGENGRPFLVREWRHGDIDPAVAAPSASRDDNQGSERNCLPSVPPMQPAARADEI
jgi:general secretion pathway protein K